MCGCLCSIANWVHLRHEWIIQRRHAFDNLTDKVSLWERPIIEGSAADIDRRCTTNALGELRDSDLPWLFPEESFAAIVLDKEVSDEQAHTIKRLFPEADVCRARLCLKRTNCMPSAGIGG
jgi:hypothetical protein